MFITNNPASFYLWWKENLVKHQKVTKHYVHDYRRNIRTTKFDFDTISTIRAVLWRNLPNDIKNSDSLNIFKDIKQLNPDNCPCQICGNFVKNLGYI